MSKPRTQYRMSLGVFRAEILARYYPSLLSSKVNIKLLSELRDSLESYSSLKFALIRSIYV